MDASNRRRWTTPALLLAWSALAALTSGCTQVRRGIQQDAETMRVIPEAIGRGFENENAAGTMMSRAIQEDIGPWGFWESVGRGIDADLEYWAK